MASSGDILKIVEDTYLTAHSTLLTAVTYIESSAYRTLANTHLLHLLRASSLPTSRYSTLAHHPAVLTLNSPISSLAGSLKGGLRPRQPQPQPQPFFSSAHSDAP